MQELRIADYIKAYMTTGRPPAPVPQEPVDPAARTGLGLPLLFQPHVDLEKTSGGGASTEQTAPPSHVNGVSQSQDSEAAGFESITAEEPFRGYSFEVSPFLLPSLPTAFVGGDRRWFIPSSECRLFQILQPFGSAADPG